MKYINNIKTVIITLCLLSIGSCSKDDDGGGGAKDRVIPNTPITASVIGSVYDLQNNPVEDVAITLGTQTVVTDQNGVYSFRDVTMNKNGTLVSASKTGYFANMKLFNPSELAISTLNFQMLEKIQVGNFSAAQGGQFSTNGNGEISIPPNAIINSAGSPYTGTVIVSAFWIDPNSVNVGDQMPGDLRGFALDNETVQLATYGMMAIELNSPSGEELNLILGSTATLTLPIPDALQTNAPSGIPTWFMNESTGYWEEEGMAEKVGGNYIAEVSHFSFWNCDAPYDWIQWTQQFVDGIGNPISGVEVRVTVTDFGLCGSSITNSQGIVTGGIPRNEQVEIEVFEPDCSTAIFLETLGPFSSDTNSPPITLGPTTLKYVNLSGNVLNCDGLPLTNGVVKLLNSSKLFPINNDGSINVNFYNCTNSFSLLLIDIINAKQSQELTFNTPDPINSINIGTESACFDLDEFIYIVNPDSTSLYSDVGFLGGLGNIVNGVDSEYSENGISIQWTGNNTGDFSIMFSQFHCSSNGLDCFGYSCYSSNGCNEEVTITLFDNTGGYIEGNFSGFFQSGNSTNNELVTGSFRVKND